MFRFFKNFRKLSIDKGQLKNYLLYALGEILVTVVGILIALAIDNRNTEITKNKEFERGFCQLYSDLHCEIGFNENSLRLLKKKLKIALTEFNETDTIKGLEIPKRLAYLNSQRLMVYEKNSYILGHLQENIVTQEQNQFMYQIGSYYSILEISNDINKNLDENYFDDLFDKYGLQLPSKFTISEFSEEDIEKAIRIRQDKNYKPRLSTTINKLNDLIFDFEYKINEAIALQEYFFTQSNPPILNFERIGIIGNALPTGWKKSVPMELINKEKAIWSIRIELQDGEIKFRNGNNWNQNWGATSSVDGNLLFFGSDIPVQKGYYEVTLYIEDKKYTIQKISEGKEDNK